MKPILVVFVPLMLAGAGAQTVLNLPAVVSQQCSGDTCAKVPPENSGGRTPALSSEGLQSAAQNGTSNTSRNKPAELQLQYPPSAAEHPTEFQKFVYSSTGQQLPIYGHSLFDNVPTTFAPVDRVPVPLDYVVGPGDELLIRAWGQIDLDGRVEVDRNGQIYLPKVGTINVAGLKYENLNAYLRNAIGQLFKNFDLNVNLGQLRSIQVFVVGRARRPGTYTVSSLSTLVNALFASGGPALDGSMRRIELKRQNKVVTEFDIYDLLVNGDKSKDAVLQPGDVIYIPPIGKVVAISGSVNLPAIYELQDPARVKDGIVIAGGLSATADVNRAVLERIMKRDSREVEEFALDDNGMDHILQDGDVLRIFPVSPKFENAVTLRGNVAQPGLYPWRSGMRIRDLIPSRDVLITPAYWSQQNALGHANSSWIDNQPNAIVRTGIKRSPAEISWDYAVILRLDQSNLSSHLLAFNLGRAIDIPSSDDNLALQPGDVVTVFSQEDLVMPVEQQTKFVSIEGEVRAAGVYRANPGESLRDIVNRAGGLTPNAYLFAADFRRESTRVSQQQQLEKMVDEMDKQLRSKATVLASSGGPESVLENQQEIAVQERVLEKLRRVEATGRIVLELKPGDDNTRALPALALEDGDRLIIPPRPETVTVVGAVYNQNSFIYKPGQTVGEYLSQAGGGTRDADRGRLFVIRADGSVVSKQMHRATWFDSFESLKLMPGDSVVMPEKIRTGNTLRGIRDWSQVFSQFALGAAALKVIQ